MIGCASAAEILENKGVSAETGLSLQLLISIYIPCFVKPPNILSRISSDTNV
jgi:hypothetical protein